MIGGPKEESARARPYRCEHEEGDKIEGGFPSSNVLEIMAKAASREA